MENDLLDLKSLGKEGDKIILTKIESPIGVVLKKTGSSKLVNATPKKITRAKIQLGETIEVGKKIIKNCLKKRGKGCDRNHELFYATLSCVDRIIRHKQTNDIYFIFTKNSKYKAKII